MPAPGSPKARNQCTQGTPRILYCRCAYAQVVPRETKDGVLRELAGSGRPFETVADLCEMSARRDPALRRLAESGRLRIAACYPRAVRGLFRAAGAPLPEEGVEVLNMRTDEAPRIAQRLVGEVSAPGSAPGSGPGSGPGNDGGDNGEKEAPA